MRRFRDKRLYERGESRFIWAKLRNEAGKIKPVSTRCTDEAAATAFCDEWERKAVSPSYRRATEATFGTAYQDFLDEQRRQQVSAATMEIAVTKLGHAVRLWGPSFPLLRITNDVIMAYIDQRASEGVVRYTVGKELNHLKRMLAWAKFRGYFPPELATIFPPNFSGGHKPRSHWITREQAFKLLSVMAPARAAHVAFILATGARWAESIRACRGDVDFATGLVTMQGSKTELAAGVVPLSGLTWDFIVFAIEKAPASAPLFARWGVGNHWRDLQAACARAGIPSTSANDLRRSFGQWHRDAFITEGGMSKETSAELVSVLLRHATDKLAQTTYAKVGGADVAARVRALSPVPILSSGTASTARIEGNDPMKNDDYSHARHDSNMGHPASKASPHETTQSPRSIGNKQAWERRSPGQSVADVTVPRDSWEES